jgi:DNA gyrase/topoisomerase IV subunit A
MTPASKYLLNTSREYAIYVCDTRGIPSVIDGLKTSQRIALWLLRNKAEKVKTVGLAGQMAAEKLYVHGDASANGAINLLAAPFKNNTPLIEGLGEFGSRIKPDGIGAPRYTDVKRSKAAEAFLYTDLPNVPLTPNYDGSNMQPSHFLPLIPTVLLNGISGVAVGYSTEVLPRSLKDLVQATIDTVQGKKPKKLMPAWTAYNVDVKGIGPNQYEITGQAEIPNTSMIRVTELPPGVKLDDFRKRLIKMEEDDLIHDFDDNSAETINIEVTVKRGMVKGWTPQKAIDFLKLKEKITERIVVLDWNGRSIRTYDDPLDLVKDFVAFRLDVYVQRYQRLLNEHQYDLVYWKTLKALFDGGFTKKLGTFPNKLAVTDEIAAVAKKAKLSPDADQVERAAGLPTYRWTKDFYEEVLKRIKEIEANIKEYKLNLDKPERIRNIYIEELEELKKLK